MESNVFKTPEVDGAPRAVVTLGAAAAGILVEGVAFATHPFGPAFVALAWGLVAAGLALALCRGRSRWVGTGLLFGGAAIPLSMLGWLWVAFSAMVLFP
jgi:hypothetical protein